jgi:hypothetical protein
VEKLLALPLETKKTPLHNRRDGNAVDELKRFILSTTALDPAKRAPMCTVVVDHLWG